MNILEIINNFKIPIIINNKYTLESLKQDTIYFENLNPNEYQYLKEIGEKTVINLMESADTIKFITCLRSNNQMNKIVITLQDKEKFNRKILATNIDYSNIFIKIDKISSPISLEQYIKNEQILYSMVEEAKDYSPLEKYIYVHEIVKRFKEYKEHESNKLLSRKLYDIIYNNYIVCSGYTNLQVDLLNKLGIKSIQESVEIDMTSFEAIKLLKQKYKWKSLKSKIKYRLIKELRPYIISQTFGKHSRLIVRLIDKKYGIDGIFFNDVTFDNSLTDSFYNYLLLTQHEITSSIHKMKLTSDAKELLYVDSMREFYDKLNYLMRCNLADNQNNISKREMINSITAVLAIIKPLLIILRKLDPQFIDMLYQKYQVTDKLPNINSMLSELGNYIVGKVNNHIEDKKIISAIQFIYNNAFENGLQDEELIEIINLNNDQNMLEFGYNRFNKKFLDDLLKKK